MNRVRLGLALAGMAAALLAVTWDDGRLGWAAIALLAGALIIRVLRRGETDAGSEDGS